MTNMLELSGSIMLVDSSQLLLKRSLRIWSMAVECVDASNFETGKLLGNGVVDGLRRQRALRIEADQFYLRIQGEARWHIVLPQYFFRMAGVGWRISGGGIEVGDADLLEDGDELLDLFRSHIILSDTGAAEDGFRIGHGEEQSYCKQDV